MREILFRGKRRDNGEWVEGDILNNRQRDSVYISTRAYPTDMLIPCGSGVRGEWIGYEDIIPETLGQYTGLTDKNGKKIFEGDIVRNITDYDDAWGDTHTVVDVGAVIWDETNCAWSVINDADTTSLCEWIEGDFTVIGNIHDNSELLQEV